MARINSRKKGQRSERKICKILEEWTGYEFDRVPASGGLRWAKTDNITGDVVCTDPLHRFDFSIESKSYEDINFSHMILPNVRSRILDEFWPQCIKDAERGKKIPLLLMRYTNIIPGNYYFTVLKYKHFKLLKPHITFKSKYMKVGDLIIMSSLDFFTAPYKQVKSITKKLIKSTYELK